MSDPVIREVPYAYEMDGAFSRSHGMLVLGDPAHTVRHLYDGAQLARAIAVSVASAATLTEAEMEEIGFQWTGQRLPYAKMDPRFIARARQIVEPVLAMRRARPEEE